MDDLNSTLTSQPVIMQQPLHQHMALYVMSVISTSFWIIIWVMHLCALTNAKMKFSKRSYLQPACDKRKTKPALLGTGKQRESVTHFPTDIQKNGVCTGLHEQQSPSKKPLFSSHDNQMKQQQYLSPKQNLLMLDQESAPIQDPPNLCYSPPANINTLDSNCFCCVEASQDDNNNNINISTNNLSKQLYSFDQSLYSYINLPLPGVSVIKPLMGFDKNLYCNLETFFHMDYPTYELLFCVQDMNDVAILVVEELFKKYPNSDAKLFIGGARVGVNPKINNMQPAYEAMKYELVLISDSGISMRPDTLLDMVSHMNDDVALVHQMPFVNCHGRNNFRAIVERVYFGTAHARAYLTADLLNINCSTGMSALMRKCLLDEVGGIKAFGQYLAEDFFFAKSFTDRGWKLCISSQPALQNSATSSDTLSTLNSRIQRWIKLRFAMVPQWTLLEPFSECMLLGLLVAASVNFLWSLNPFAVFSIHVLLWFSFDYKLLCTIQNGPLTCSRIDFLMAWLVRECTALLVFLKALADPRVTWRSREFRLRWGGYTEEVSSPDTF